jgi:hypothetical protein
MAAAAADGDAAPINHSYGAVAAEPSTYTRIARPASVTSHADGYQVGDLDIRE